MVFFLSVMISYYTVSVNVTPVECDENSLNVSWKVNDELLKSQNNWTIQVSRYLQVSYGFQAHI